MVCRRIISLSWPRSLNDAPEDLSVHRVLAFASHRAAEVVAGAAVVHRRRSAGYAGRRPIRELRQPHAKASFAKGQLAIGALVEHGDLGDEAATAKIFFGQGRVAQEVVKGVLPHEIAVRHRPHLGGDPFATA